MPRQPRTHVDNGFYHVLARGNNKDEVFYRPEDYQAYLSILKTFSQRTGVLLHAYTLMPNHVHLLVQIRASPLSGFMKGVQQTYTQDFNRRYSRVGHVFQGRYKAILVDDDSYLLALIRYIHLNPVRAGITHTPEDYPWTSHHHYTTGKGPGQVCTALVRDVLASYGVKSIQDFDIFISSKAQDAIAPPAISDNDYIEAQFATILRTVAGVTGVDPARITGQDRASNRTRHILIYYAIHQADFSVTTLAQLLGCSSVAIKRTARKVAAKLETGDKELHEALTAIRTKGV